MTVKTLQFIEVDSDPMHWSAWDGAFAEALALLVDQPEEAVCDNCKGLVGYHLLETDDGRLEHAYWHYTALILHGPQFPVVRLCEDCAAPVIQPLAAYSGDWVSDQRGVTSLVGTTHLLVTPGPEGRVNLTPIEGN